MAKDSSSQKFIGKNNAPRVQIEYDVELYGSQKKVELPLSRGHVRSLWASEKPLLPIEERKFLTFDQDNFNDRMRAIKPRLQFYVENTLSEDDALLDVELEFESMEDFSPGAIAKRVPQMQRLLEAREHLTELITYMDGKSSAEEVVKNLLEKPDFLHRLVTDARKTVADAEQDVQDSGNKGDEE